MPKTNEGSQLSQIVMPWAQPLSSVLAVQSAVTFNDTNARLTQYIGPLEQQGGAMLQRYKAGLLGPHNVAVHDFVKLRSQLMNITRGAISPGALAMSEFIKEKPPTEADLRIKYAQKLRVDPYSIQVSEMIMKKSIQTNPAVTGHAMRWRLFGITGVALFPGLLTFRLYQARSEDRVYETFRAGSEVVGGALAVWRGVPAMWAACKVAIPELAPKRVVVLHVVFNLAASTAGSVIGGHVADTARDA